MLQSLVLGLQSSSFPLTYFPTIVNTNYFNLFNDAIILRHFLHHKYLVIFLHCHWIRSSHCHISSCSTPLPSHPTRNRLQTRPTMSYQSTWRLSTGSLPSAPPVRLGPPIFSSPLLCPHSIFTCLKCPQLTGKQQLDSS